MRQTLVYALGSVDERHDANSQSRKTEERAVTLLLVENKKSMRYTITPANSMVSPTGPMATTTAARQNRSPKKRIVRGYLRRSTSNEFMTSSLSLALQSTPFFCRNLHPAAQIEQDSPEPFKIYGALTELPVKTVEIEQRNDTFLFCGIPPFSGDLTGHLGSANRISTLNAGFYS